MCFLRSARTNQSAFRRYSCFCRAYTAIMRGRPTTRLITSAWQKGLLRKADEHQAYEAMKKSYPLLIRDAGVGEMVQGTFGVFHDILGLAESMGGVSALMKTGLFCLRGTSSKEPFMRLPRLSLTR